MQEITTLSDFYNLQRVSTKPLTEFERDAVIYFFAKLKISDARFYDSLMPDEKTEKIFKREYSEMIRGLTKEKIDRGFFELNKRIADRDPDYEYLRIQRVIELCVNGAGGEGNPVAAHKYFEPVLAIEDKTAKEKRYQLGQEQCANILSMLEEE